MRDTELRATMPLGIVQASLTFAESHRRDSRARFQVTIWGLVLMIVAAVGACPAEPLESQKEMPPRFTSPKSTEAAGGINYNYTATFTAPTGPSASVVYLAYPSWLKVEDGSVKGTPPDGATDTSIAVVVSDGLLAETTRVAIKITPNIVVYGDTRTGSVVHRQITALIVRTQPTVVFHTGDLVSTGSLPDDWAKFNSIAAPLRAIAEFYPALGNHEGQSALFFNNFKLPNNEQWYSVERNRICFVVLNSSAATDVNSPQYHWLDSTLAAAATDSIEFKVAIIHDPPFSSGAHPEDEKGLRLTLVPLFERYKVAVVFSGHDHDYERSYCGGIYYIVTGGGGAPLYNRARNLPCSQEFAKKYHFCRLARVGDRMIITVVGLDSQEIDKFEVH